MSGLTCGTSSIGIGGSSLSTCSGQSNSLNALTWSTGTTTTSGWIIQPSPYYTTGSNSTVIGYQAGAWCSQSITWPDLPVLTRKQLREYCRTYDITKEVFDELEEQIPLGANLLEELLKIGETKHTYVKYLLREKKLRRILYE